MKRKGVVWAQSSSLQLFAVWALDKIAHNPSSTTATVIIPWDRYQPVPVSYQFKHGASPIGYQPIPSKKHHPDLDLPENFTTVRAVALRKESVAVPRTSYGHPTPISGHLDNARDEENKCLRTCHFAHWKGKFGPGEMRLPGLLTNRLL
ncbi:hypothetical protein GWK47_016974 [Chionoecetes opilio]|uniref:Uncharacterized protein n=1 Tax=Chionoecetes opilio TaxID=41210 RepID=A0A8J4XR69_CHIOP|nr:hypothetical protein GWK47_016974 [Chionoecetes opilio]